MVRQGPGLCQTQDLSHQRHIKTPQMTHGKPQFPLISSVVGSFLKLLHQQDCMPQ